MASGWLGAYASPALSQRIVWSRALRGGARGCGGRRDGIGPRENVSRPDHSAGRFLMILARPHREGDPRPVRVACRLCGGARSFSCSPDTRFSSRFSFPSRRVSSTSSSSRRCSLCCLCPLLTMRQFAEERRAGTLELLLTSPAAEIEIVVAKFAATMMVILAMLGRHFDLRIHPGGVRNAGLGARLQRLFGTGSARRRACLAWACDIRPDGEPSGGRRRVIRSLRAVVGDQFAWRLLLPSPVDNWFIGLSLLARFTPFATGAMYISDLGFFLSVILLGLFLTVRALARR